jgi:hypothetical protein
MSEDNADGPPKPRVVAYHPVTGVPEEFHEYLHKDCDEYKRLKAASTAEAAGDVAEGVAGISLEARRKLLLSLVVAPTGAALQVASSGR